MSGSATFAERFGVVSTTIIGAYVVLLVALLAAIFVTFPPAELLESKFRIAAIVGALLVMAALLFACRAEAGTRLFVAYMLVLVNVFAASAEAYFARDVFMNPRRAAALSAGQPYEPGFPRTSQLPGGMQMPASASRSRRPTFTRPRSRSMATP